MKDSKIPGYRHLPVLLKEAIDLLNPQPGENFIDATLGGGGYTKAILERNQPDGKVLAIDLDEEAIKNFKYQITDVKNQKPSPLIPLPMGEGRVRVVHGNFADVDKIVEQHKFFNISGVVADLGLSSNELEQSGRGFSFQRKELLDMRFDQQGTGVDARFILNTYEQKRLEKIFKEYGEEKYAARMARKIQETRTKSQIKYTTDLYQIIVSSLPKPIRHKADDSARRIFQALRIAVNHELENLEEFLPKAFDLLSFGGRLAVVSFHSLEDRMVKQYFNQLSKGCVCPPEFPICQCGRSPKAKLLVRKPVTASDSELQANPRSKPAKLRAVIKI